jgi:hypothetical protein
VRERGRGGVLGYADARTYCSWGVTTTTVAKM